MPFPYQSRKIYVGYTYHIRKIYVGYTLFYRRNTLSSSYLLHASFCFLSRYHFDTTPLPSCTFPVPSPFFPATCLSLGVTPILSLHPIVLPVRHTMITLINNVLYSKKGIINSDTTTLNISGTMPLMEHHGSYLSLMEVIIWEKYYTNIKVLYLKILQSKKEQ